MLTINKEYEYYRILDKLGGQHFKGILTPADLPIIILISNEEKEKGNMLELIEEGSVKYSFEGEPGFQKENRGNKAVINHKNYKGYYHSILIFTKRGSKEQAMLKYVGEFTYRGTERDVVNGFDNYYFILDRIEPFDVNLYQIESFYALEDEDKVSLVKLLNLDDLLDENNQMADDEFVAVDKIEKMKDWDEDTIVGSIVVKKAVSYEKVWPLEYPSNINPEIKNCFSNENSSELGIEQQHILMRLNQQYYIRERMRKRFVPLIKKGRALEKKQEGYSIVESYNVNSGCANCVFVVTKSKKGKELWCFDAGFGTGIHRNTKAYPKLKDYEENICKCLEYIQFTHFSRQKLRFSKIFISHPHADHYNFFLNCEESLYQDSELWLNPYFGSLSEKFILFLIKMSSKVNAVIEPISENSIGGVIDILFPKVRSISRTNSDWLKNTRIGSKECFETSDYNLLSPVIVVSSETKKMVVTGDVGKQGLEVLDKKISNKELVIDIYNHSHHGSEKSHMIDGNHSIINGLCNKVNLVSIVMGYDNAYPTMITTEIKNKSKELKLRVTEELVVDKFQFFKVDWQTEIIEKIKYENKRWISTKI